MMLVTPPDELPLALMGVMDELLVVVTRPLSVSGEAELALLPGCVVVVVAVVVAPLGPMVTRVVVVRGCCC